MNNQDGDQQETTNHGWGVCAVALPRESYYWLQDWIEHHLKAGASKIVIYDNTGSLGSQRKTSAFHSGNLQKEAKSKRGEEYGRHTSHLTDRQICRELRDLAKRYDGKVDIITWRPKHPERNEIIHAQIEAYCDFVRRYRSSVKWGLFIDLDEYIYCKPGLQIHSVIRYLEESMPGIALIQLYDWQFECRWGKNGPNDITTHLKHHPSRHGGGKVLARLLDVTYANNHLGWDVKEGLLRVLINRVDVGLAHYNLKPEFLQKGVSIIKPRAFLDSAPDNSSTLSLLTPLSKSCEGEKPLPIETTFVEMLSQDP